MRLSHLLAKTRPALLPVLEDLNKPSHEQHAPTACVLFFSVCNGAERAHIEIARAPTWHQAWDLGQQALERWHRQQTLPLRWLRVDAVDQVQAQSWGELETELKDTKRNYFECGIAWDAQFTRAVLAIELGANALLYNNQETPCTPHAVNLKTYGKRRFGAELTWPAQADQTIWTFSTRAVFTDGENVHTIEHQGRHAGYRQVTDWGSERVRAIVHTASDFLARQVKSSGEYHYGWFPCFDRAIPHYNTLRHASSTDALLDGWSLTQRASDKAAIDRALEYLTRHLIVDAVLPNGDTAAFLVDTGDEIKLGGNAVCLLALVKYTELTGDRQHLPLMERLALGLQHMQDPVSGRFVHVLNHPDLSLKAEHRIIYYDGEAAFGLMRLYGLTRDPRWLAMVEKAFEHFIAAKHWKAHDHWLSYCVNELTLYKPDDRYYRFGLQNVSGHLDFVIERITTFPTLLELMMAAQKMIERLQADPERAHLLNGFDLAKFQRALEVRARYLLNGFFWPEVAMFFKHPNRIVGGFFIRHHSFRVRIDDVEHYLSGYVAYWKCVRARQGTRQFSGQPPVGAYGC